MTTDEYNAELARATAYADCATGLRKAQSFGYLNGADVADKDAYAAELCQIGVDLTQKAADLTRILVAKLKQGE